MKKHGAAPKKAAGILAIGCSAGGVEALLKLLPSLPEGLPQAVVVVLHLPPDGDPMLPQIFAPKCRIAVKEAEDKEELESGTLYFAPSGYHLLVEREGLFSLSAEEPVNFSRPSIDVFFESVAVAYGSRAIGTVLTGANADGSIGIRAILEYGGRAAIQDPQTADYPKMPEAAVEAAGKSDATLVLSLEKIGRLFADLDSRTVESLWKK
jgi:two-component system chemotaxis response regulator CheB